MVAEAGFELTTFGYESEFGVFAVHTPFFTRFRITVNVGSGFINLPSTRNHAFHSPNSELMAICGNLWWQRGGSQIAKRD